MVHLLPTRRKFILGTAIYDSSLSAKAKSSTGSVHSHITSTYYNHFLSGMDRSHIVGAIGFHEVVACQELIRRADTIEVLARNTHKLRQSCTRADEHCIKSFLIKKIIDFNGPSCYNIRFYLHPKGLHSIDFRFHNFILRKTELGDTIHENATGAMKSLEYCYLITEFGKVGCTGQTSWTTTDHCNLMPV